MPKPNPFLEKHLQRYEQEGYSYLAQLPEVKRFLETDLFESITLARERLIADLVLLEYEVVAPKLFPHPRARLLDGGLVNKNHLLRSGLILNGVSVTVGCFGSILQIALRIRDQVTAVTNDDSQIKK
jgi:hypothetical protein